MQFIFSDPYYDSEDWDEKKYLNEVTDLLCSFDSSLVVEYANIGHGADWPGVLVELFNHVDWKILIGGSAAGTFLLGDKINKNLDAWVSIFNKTAQLIKKIKPTRIDEQASLVLVLNSMVEKGYDISSIEINLQVTPFTKGPCRSNLKLETTPDALYLITIKTNDKVFVVGMKSNSKIEFEHEFSTAWHNF